MLRTTRRVLPVDPTPLIGLVANQAVLRGPLERRFGARASAPRSRWPAPRPPGVNRHVLSPATDLVHRVLLVRQEAARRAADVVLLTDTVPALSIAMRPPPDLDPARLLAELTASEPVAVEKEVVTVGQGAEGRLP